MDLIGQKKLQDFTKQYPDTKSQVESLVAEIKYADWKTPNELKNHYPKKADILKNKNVIINICWNNYRIWLKVDYKNGIVFVKEAGTHKEYDKWRII